jgi:hypothetical protein
MPPQEATSIFSPAEGLPEHFQASQPRTQRKRLVGFEPAPTAEAKTETIIRFIQVLR